ncbi:RSC complex protein [Lentinula aciculospora]|uniref:RSC complex protein n=1 Tax=Lentinula aciculospora TaxID=153920 RepID=A0A9W9AMC4_9AGAR|nr:RSC complex protein [Lentinula aciculospora]
MKRDRGSTTMEEGPSKRRKADEAGSVSDIDMVGEEDYVALDEEEREEEGLEEKAMSLWQTVKDAMKDERPLSLQFLKRPNPRIYPDYYAIIRNPIALEDIKKKIKTGQYTDLESVRKDFELCFNNAKDYNIQESLIYNDAKDLLKLANKTYRKLMPSEHRENGKPPSMKRLLNSRIQKLMKKTDENGRILSTIFLELPSKKMWPVYYKQIPEPRCLETIQKQVKRKEYKSVSDFARDVELVFSNAMAFNLEHTQIWEDASTLRDYFRQLMADLPPPYALPQYAHPPKIKIKMSAAQSAAHSPPKVEEPAPAPTPLPHISLRVPAPAKPAASNAPEAKAPSPKPPVAVTPVKAAPNPVQPASTLVVAALDSRTSQSRTPQPILQLHPTMSVYGNNTIPKSKQPSYMQPTPPPVPPAAAIAPSYIASFVSKSVPHPAPVLASPPPPSPVIPPIHQLRQISLKTEPRGRHLKLDHRDGVTSWAVPLERDEKRLLVQDIVFMAETVDSSGEEDEGEDDVEMDADTGPGPGPLKKRRGRPPKIAKVATVKSKTPSLKKKKPKKRGETLVKINGAVVKEDEVHSGNWNVELSLGSNVVELGEQGGLTWKVYAERVA